MHFAHSKRDRETAGRGWAIGLGFAYKGAAALAGNPKPRGESMASKKATKKLKKVKALKKVKNLATMVEY